MADSTEVRPRRRRILPIILGIGLVLLLILAGVILNTLRQGVNPFSTVKRTQIEGQITAQLKEQHQLVVNRAEFDNILISQSDANKYVPNVWHSDTVYKVNGWVDVYIDTAKIKVNVASNGTATASLPQPQLSDAYIDLAHSNQVTKSCGINIFCSVDSLTVLRTAQGKFHDEAVHNPDLMPRSRTQAEHIITGLLTSAGAKTVTFNWSPAP